ncbi:MAG: McrC family protein [Muribaculaceae bacterium]|nr:McrC family protein [Muribaculaceae bacterium]
MITIREHRKIEPEKLQSLDFDKLKQRINYNTSCFDTSKINLMRYEFDPTPAHPKDGFYSYFRIGAEWLDEAQTEALVVLPKIERIDFIDMFMTCLRASSPEDNFSAVYDIDLDARPVRSSLLNSILSPLLIVQYLMIVSHICERGLRKGYVTREENLSKVRGRIDFRKNEIRNIRTAHKERIYCRYDDYSVDTPENRYLKRALRIASAMIALMTDHRCHPTLQALCNHCLSTFTDVTDTFDEFTVNTRNNKLFREYDDAMRIARMIIRKEEMAVNSRRNATSDIVPVFRIDMSLLFEHYVLAKLRDTFGQNNIIYQARGSNCFIADFLINTGNLKVIADAKYTEIYDTGAAKGDYVKQLCGYARDTRLLHLLNIDCTNPDAVPVVPCTLIYPELQPQTPVPFSLLRNPNKHTIKYFTTTVPIPLL